VESMFDMFKKVNGAFQLAAPCNGLLFLEEGPDRGAQFCVARERMIGWYHTGPKLRASDLEINELFKGFIARPVMVIVDVRPQTVGIPTDAYFAVEEIKDVRACHSEPFLPSLGTVSPNIYASGMHARPSPYRTVQKHVKRSFMHPQLSRQKRQRR
jgi:JAB1/Mov34/MPN/PAD-1 ubiquitin protease